MSKDKIKVTENDQVMVEARVKTQCLYWFTQPKLHQILLHKTIKGSH